MRECSLADHQKFIHTDVKYAVPLRATDYMFDLEDLTHVWPNRFKEKYT
jgi:hypothetical protein